MKFSLRIDAGGTYTDAVLVRDMDGSIMATSKAHTTGTGSPVALILVGDHPTKGNLPCKALYNSVRRSYVR
jgi:N-methylhydantoinase A/oxoprolinase/acetone carboxylase beta subunit